MTLETYIREKYAANLATGEIMGPRGPAGHLHNSGYYRVCFNIKGKRFYKWRSHVIWFLACGYWPKELDHRNRNSKDDCLENLREVTSRQNAANRAPKSNGLPVGVSKTKSNLSRPYTASIHYNDEGHYLGCYRTPERARQVYMQALKDLKDTAFK